MIDADAVFDTIEGRYRVQKWVDASRYLSTVEIRLPIMNVVGLLFVYAGQYGISVPAVNGANLNQTKKEQLIENNRR